METAGFDCSRISPSPKSLCPCRSQALLVKAMPPPWPEIAQAETLAAPTTIRDALRVILDSEPGLYDRASRAEQVLLAELRPGYSHVSPPAVIPDLLELWEQSCGKPQDVLQFGLAYAQTQIAAALPTDMRLKLHRRFVSWLKQNYSLLQSTPNPSVLRLPTLLDRLDEEYAGERLVSVRCRFARSPCLGACPEAMDGGDSIIVGANTCAAFAVLPTVTSLSRRALFEGKLPSQFSSDAHSQSLERKLWTQRYPHIGDYFAVGEATGFSDSLAKGKTRICVVDVSWDKRGHSIDPRTDSVSDAANTWAGRTPLAWMVRDALQSGYKVVLTADHGQVGVSGQGQA